MMEGIDVSYYQGQIDWAKVAKAGKRFAIIRSGDGKFLDPMSETYIKGALDNGLAVSIYHYLRFALDPESHADICARRLREAASLGAKDFLWLDWEDTSAQAKIMTVQQRQWWASEFLDSLEKNNDVFTYGHYTGTWWFQPYLDTVTTCTVKLQDQFFDHPLWIGQYPSMGDCLSDPTAKGLKPTLPKDWTDWQVWQYTSSGRVDGIEGNVDLDIAREGFLDLKEGDMSGFSEVQLNEMRAIINKAITDAADGKIEPEALEMAARGAVSTPVLKAFLSAITGHWENLQADVVSIETAARFWHKWPGS
jgi:GH25 family lysozyme M1 (1,4-beta-N-acetylmuramidase)